MAEGGLTRTKVMLSFIVLLSASITYTSAIDTISANQTIRNGETIVSPQETFELGFFKPGNSTNYYIGIWYKKISTGTVVWVANRNRPLTNTSGDLTLTLQGVLILRNATGNVIWSSTSSSTPSVRNPVGQLLDSGNFIIHEDTDQESPIWQSFDFPTDHLLPGMKFGRDLVTGIQRNVTSWKSPNDPAVGDFTAFIDTRGFPQMILSDGLKTIFRAGPWNGLWFSGEPDLRSNQIYYNFSFVLNAREIYYHYNLIHNSVFTWLMLRPNGNMERLLWVNCTKEWTVYLSPQIDDCDRFNRCGSFASCNINDSPPCQCLKGFKPTSLDQRRVADWDHGCQHGTPLNCGPGEGFNRYSNLKLPDTQRSKFNQTWTLDECERVCKNDCSCTAYTHSDISGSGSGCLLWFGDLIDIRTLSENGQDIFIRLPPWELGTNREECGHDSVNNSENEDLELPLFSFSTLVKATNRFSLNNKLGEGGFGPVYKAWELHKEGKYVQLVAKGLVESINLSQVLRSIHVGLLCVQRRPEDRPTMTSVILMLGSEGPIPSPKEPGFFIGKNTEDAPAAPHSSGTYDTSSTNDLSITILNGR
ncbi:hypothetical protein L1887_25433 [Cichorium endivia]|nr:hypothetical protein L1887_25433 [Cichorium endivia]